MVGDRNSKQRSIPCGLEIGCGGGVVELYGQRRHPNHKKKQAPIGARPLPRGLDEFQGDAVLLSGLKVPDALFSM